MPVAKVAIAEDLLLIFYDFKADEVVMQILKKRLKQCVEMYMRLDISVNN